MCSSESNGTFCRKVGLLPQMGNDKLSFVHHVLVKMLLLRILISWLVIDIFFGKLFLAGGASSQWTACSGEDTNRPV